MASSDTPKCILLRGDPLYGEGAASGVITPGMLVSVAGGAITTSFAPTVTAGAAAQATAIFARENEVIGDGIDDDYADGENVLFMNMRKGDWVYAFVPAAEAAVTIGDLLEAGASGTLTAATTNPVLAKALEAVDNSGGGSPARIKVEIV